jgi:Replication initiator protein A
MLNEWLFNAKMAREILTLNRDYFRLGGGLERRL